MGDNYSLRSDIEKSTEQAEFSSFYHHRQQIFKVCSLYYNFLDSVNPLK